MTSQSPLLDAGKPAVVTGEAMLAGETTAAKAWRRSAPVRPVVRPATNRFLTSESSEF
jgi:hypothetical protein